jgi:flagellar FliL protein
MATAPEKKEEKEEAAPAPSSGGGFKAWVPLLVTILLMPVLAFVTTNFVLIPKLDKSLGGETAHARENGGGESNTASHGEGKTGKEGPAAGKAKIKIPLSKIVVNVSGSLGSRLLLASLTIAGNNNDMKTKIEENNDQLRDLASSVLSTKTITDLEKPEARNLIRAELISQFNTILGGTVQDIYITEFAIQ